MAAGPINTLFMPQGESEFLHELFANTPRFLFRTWTPKSAGFTSSTQVRSKAAGYRKPIEDLFGREVHAARRILKFHLLWWEEFDDNLISWTNSIIFALQHGIRKSVDHGREKEDASTIQLMILDTYAFPRGVFLSAHDLLEAYNLASDSAIKKRWNWYHGEYLSQGVLDLPAAATVITTLAQLEDLGLKSLYSPSRDFGKNTLWLAVDDARKRIKDVSQNRKELSTNEIETAQRIATSITKKRKFRPFIMAMLLSMKPRYRIEPLILRAFKTNGWGRRPPSPQRA